MSFEAATNEIERIAALGVAEAGSPGFPALAEAHRRAGDAEAALRVAREGLERRPSVAAGRVAAALALLDLGRQDEARDELERVLADVPDHPLAARALRDAAGGAESPSAFADLGEAELEDAFEEAQTEREEMVDANRVAEAALHHVEGGEPEGVLHPDSPFATETVAGLLERQGHDDEARVLRQTLGRSRPREGTRMDPAKRTRVVATLERWLDHLRRGSR